MGADDCIAVVYHDGIWYVGHVQGGNYWNVIGSDDSFATKSEALVYAASLSGKIWSSPGIKIYGSS